MAAPPPNDNNGSLTATKTKIALGVATAVGASTLAFISKAQNRDWMAVEAQTWWMQLRYGLGVRLDSQWLLGQRVLWRLINLEFAHQLEVRQAARAGIDLYTQKNLNPLLPHVDTKAAEPAQRGRLATLLFGPLPPPKKMPTTTGPILKDLVLIGGGHSHAFILKSFGMAPIPGVRLILITRDVVTPYSGMLPGHIAGYYSKAECHLDLILLGRFARAVVIQAEANGIDRANNLVYVSDGRPPIHYDVLSIDIGSAPLAIDRALTDAAELPLVAVKPIDGFSARWEILMDRVLSQDRKVRVAVVGAGAGGVELCLSMQARLHRELRAIGKPADQAEFVLFSRSPTVMGYHSPAAQAVFARILADRGVEVHLSCEVVGVDTHEGQAYLVCSNGTRVQCDECVWCTSAASQPWLRDTGLELDAKGFIAVNPTLRSRNTSNIFAAGDCAAMVDNPRPKAGVFAVRAGPPLYANLKRKLLGDDNLESYLPQQTFLGIIGSGEPSVCVASLGPVAVNAPWVWRLKDWIDRKWMAGYSHVIPDKIAAMAAADQPGAEAKALARSANAIDVLNHSSMRCGGCGAKVGATILSRVMAQLRPLLYHRPEVIVGLDSPDDCAVVAAPKEGNLIVSTVDFFRSFIGDPYVFGQIATNHALSDCYAMGAEPQTALALAVLPFGAEEKVEATLLQLMSGACHVLREAGCTLVGGHTCEGTELSLGFTINGLVAKSHVMTKGGMKPGDAVILTKSIGTGTIFAAEMRGKAEGLWVKQATNAMLKSNRLPAQCLIKHQATSCTDVTGFGLAGHLVEMARACPQPTQVELFMETIPVLRGAVECAQMGILSTLHPANVKIRGVVPSDESLLLHEVYPLLFDPQTSGGLLASVPEGQVEQCLAALRMLGCDDACVIGKVQTGTEGTFVLLR